MSFAPSLHKQFALLLLSLSAALPGLAQSAQEQERLIATMTSATSFPCLTEANVMLNEQVRLLAPSGFMEGFRAGVNGRVNWSQGNKSYDQVYAIVANALLLDEANNGPVVDVPVRRLLEDVVSRWSAEERREFDAFFAAPSGKLYLVNIVDGAMCLGWMIGLNKPPYLPLTGPALTRWENRVRGRDAISDEVLKQVNTLSKAEKERFLATMPKLGNVFTEAIGRVAAANIAPAERFAAAVKPQMPEIKRLLTEAK